MTVVVNAEPELEKKAKTILDVSFFTGRFLEMLWDWVMKVRCGSCEAANCTLAAKAIIRHKSLIG